MNDERLEKLYEKCKKIGASYSQEMSQDFPGFAVEQVIRTGNYKPVRWILYDYFREKFGRPQQGTNKNRKLLNGFSKGNVQFDDPLVATPRQLTIVPDISSDIDYKNLIDLLPKELRSCCILRDKYQLTLKEIADIFGLTQPCIFNKIKKAQGILQAITNDGGRIALKKTH